MEPSCLIVPVSLLNGCIWQPLLFTDVDEVKMVILPLTPFRLAVGKLNSDWTVDSAHFNRLAAQASYIFFLANHNSLELEGYLKQLGGEVRTTISTMMDSSISEAISDLLRRGDDGYASEDILYAADRSWKEMTIEEEIQYYVSFEGFGDEDLLKTVTKEIKNCREGLLHPFTRFIIRGVCLR